MEMDLLRLIKTFSILQLILIGISILAISITKLVISRLESNKKRWSIYFEDKFAQYALDFTDEEKKRLQDFTKKYRRHFSLLVPLIKKMDKFKFTDEWSKARQIVITDILLPQFKSYASSSRWYKRYLSCQLFHLALSLPEFKVTPYISLIKALIADNVLLVALHGVKIALRSHSEILINAVIDNFAINRRLQKTLFLQSIEIHAEDIPIIAHRLNQETDVYTRILCYQMLSEQPHVFISIAMLEQDLNHANLDLQIAALNYKTLTNPDIQVLQRKLTDPAWEIRAKATQLLGKIKATSCAHAIEKCLKDENWWVRINASEALMLLGDEGIAILKKQSPEQDQFAYDSAMRVLILNQWNQHGG